MSDLKAELMDINGVGEATADKILAIVEPNTQSGYMELAIEEAQERNYQKAGMYLARATEDN